MITMMASEVPTQIHSPPSPSTKRPKGILKNSYHRSPPQQAAITTTAPPPISPVHLSRPSPPEHELTEKDITLQNTLQNAGHRRSSSAARPSASRRQSSHSSLGQSAENQDQRLKWDEANLYLTEQEKSSTMKIDEPKTPYAQHYDPDEDEDEMRMLDAGEIKVDELEMGGGSGRLGRSPGREKGGRDEEIPGLSLGEPEEAVPVEAEGERKEKAVHVKGEEHVGLSQEELEKHKKFEEMRKKHYEMKNVAGLLGHPEELDDVDDDGDADMNGIAR